MAEDTKDARRKPRSPSLLSLLSLVSFGLLLCGCHGDIEETAAAMTGGSPARGKEVIRRYGCEACHSIPGVAGARGQVGPPLDGIANRTYLAGQLNNTPENLIRWIRDPQGIQPGTAMPELGVTEQDGKDIAAYLYTLR
jgi:cytochrome c2